MADEYLKREDVLKAMEWKWAGKSAIEAVKAIPTADVAEVRHGKWELSFDKNSYKCSLCKFKYRFIDNFCPNCGARMDGE